MFIYFETPPLGGLGPGPTNIYFDIIFSFAAFVMALGALPAF